MLKEGVLLVRLFDQDKKIESLQKRGQSADAQKLEKEQSEKNANIVKAFQTHFNYCTVHFIHPQDSKTIIRDKSNIIQDIVTGASINLAGVNDIYFTDFSFGHPAEGFERYNRKGFQILYLEEGKITGLGRDLFYAGVKQGVFSPKFSKSLQKTIYKLNRRLENGSKYL